MVSEKQLNANRNNCLKSTGPQTPAGKRVVSRNAVRHGLLSSADLTVIKGEDRSEFEEFSSSLLADLAPVGQLENLLAERITGFFWRLKRTSRMETGLLDIISGLPQDADPPKSQPDIPIEVVIHKTYAEPEEYLEYQEYLKSKGRLIPDGVALPVPVCPPQNALLSADMPVSQSAVSDGKEPSLPQQFTENLGRLVQQDFKGGKLLEKLLRYEGQIERSLYRALMELQKLQFKRSRCEAIDVAPDEASGRVDYVHADESCPSESSSFGSDPNSSPFFQGGVPAGGGGIDSSLENGDRYVPTKEGCTCTRFREEVSNLGNPVKKEIENPSDVTHNTNFQRAAPAGGGGIVCESQTCGCDVSVIPNVCEESIKSEKNPISDSCNTEKPNKAILQQVDVSDARPLPAIPNQDTGYFYHSPPCPSVSPRQYDSRSGSSLSHLTDEELDWLSRQIDRLGLFDKMNA